MARFRPTARILIGLVLLGACSTDGGALRASDEQPTRGTVASVNGSAIQLSEVAEVCRRTGLLPREALAQIVSERLLVQYAEAQGYDEDSVVQRELTRARVRALLAQTVEADTQPGDTEARKRKLAALLSELAERSPPNYDEPAIAHAFAESAPSLP